MPAMFSAETKTTKTITQNVVEGPSVQRKFLMIAEGVYASAVVGKSITAM